VITKQIAVIVAAALLYIVRRSGLSPLHYFFSEAIYPRRVIFCFFEK
jgi:uncharacterized membrane protein